MAAVLAARYSGFAALHDDGWSRVLLFVPQRDLATFRCLCRRADGIVRGDVHWILRCYEAGVEGTVVSTLDDDDDANRSGGRIREPLLFGAPTHGTAVFEATEKETLLPWQMAVMAWASIGACQHVTRDAVLDYVNTALAPLARAISAGRMGPPTGMCDNCGQYRASYACIRCGKTMCSRSARGCMSNHGPEACQRRRARIHGETRPEAPTDAVAAGDGFVCVGICHTVPPQSGYCYQCNQGLQLDATEAAPPRLLASLQARDLSRSLTHCGLFLRHECPHLHRGLILRFMQHYLARQQWYIDKNCQAPPAPSCNVRHTYVCMHCGAMRCGITHGGHMHKHVIEAGHAVVVGLRSLNCYCFLCDRMLGFGGTSLDAELAALTREVVRTGRSITQHGRTGSVWCYAENIKVVQPLGATALKSLEEQLRTARKRR